jgi:hypothetical protein
MWRDQRGPIDVLSMKAEEYERRSFVLVLPEKATMVSN